jgi:hypothetical protein
MKNLNLVKLIISFLFILLTFNSNAQSIYSKDGYFIGEKDELITSLRGDFKDKYFKYENVTIDFDIFWGCILETIFANSIFSELESAIQSDNLDSYITNEKNIDLFNSCFEKSIVDLSEDDKLDTNEESHLVNQNSQSIYSKDNVYFGEKDEIIALLRGDFKDKYYEQDGAILDFDMFWGCIIENIFPNLLISELDSGFENGDIVNYFINDDNYELFYECSEKSVVDYSNYKFNKNVDEDFLKLKKENALKACIYNYLKSNKDDQNVKEANLYCNCIVEKAFSLSISFSYDDISDENSAAYNEIVLPCQKKLLNNQDIMLTNYKPEDIIGDSDFTIIPLVKNIDNSYKIKLNLNGIIKYFLFDTGAADLLINEEIENDLIENGTINNDNYYGDMYYLMANNELALARLYIIDNIKIGEYKVNNVLIAVIDGASLLCGTGFFEKFNSWDFNSKKEEIILKK